MVPELSQASSAATPAPAKAKVSLSLVTAGSVVCRLDSQTEGARLSRNESNFIACMFGAGVMVALASRSVLPLLAMLEFSSLAGSGVIVDAEEDLEKVLARGPRCVSLSSAEKQVSSKL